MPSASRVKAPERGQGLVDRVGRKQAGALHLAAEAAQDLLVEDGRDRARQRFVHHETHRVGADVDDGDGRPVAARGVRQPAFAEPLQLAIMIADVPNGA